MLQVRPARPFGVLALVGVLLGCGDTNHGISIEAHSTVPLDSRCLHEALKAFQARDDAMWTGPERDVYLVPGEMGFLSVVLAHPPGAGGSTLQVTWVEPESLARADVERAHLLMESIYNRTRERCGRLPPLGEAKQECWLSGCRG